jgi:hypothetical protein
MEVVASAGVVGRLLQSWKDGLWAPAFRAKQSAVSAPVDARRGRKAGVWRFGCMENSAAPRSSSESSGGSGRRESGARDSGLFWRLPVRGVDELAGEPGRDISGCGAESPRPSADSGVDGLYGPADGLCSRLPVAPILALLWAGSGTARSAGCIWLSVSSVASVGCSSVAWWTRLRPAFLAA